MTDPFSNGLFGIFGTGGCARSVMPVARLNLVSRGVDTSQLVFVDDFSASDTCNGHPVLSYEQFLRRPEVDKFASIAIADPAKRRELDADCRSDGIRFFGIRADQSAIMDDVEVGEGSIISPFTVLTSNIRIGRHFQANLFSYVEHDCHIGDFVTLAPGAKCNGNVVVEDGAYIGSGAIIKQGKPGNPLVIGRGALIGMGAVVTKSVPAGVVVAGNPAKLHKSQQE